MVAFGTVLKELRLRSGMSQKQLAEKLGITKSVISYYEQSERTPSPGILVKIADVFHVTTDYLLGLESKTVLDVSDLPNEDIELLDYIASALREKNIKKHKTDYRVEMACKK